MTQYPPVGPIPTPDRLLLSGLLWATEEQVSAVLPLIRDDELAEAKQSTILAAIRRCAARGQTGCCAVLDELQAFGDLAGDKGSWVAAELNDATTAGGHPDGLRQYLAAVLGAAFRRQIESYGHAVSSASQDFPEADLWPLVSSGGARVRELSERLTRVRGGDR